MPSKKVTSVSSPTTSGHVLPSSETSKPSENIKVMKLISKAKFPVYLAFSPSRNQNYALKIYDFEENKPHPYFENEKRFSILDHTNVIKILHADSETPMESSKGRSRNVSCILMEYAPYGDLFDFINKTRKKFSEKLARTYFHQLIEGIEHLHQNNVYHLDLKLENLLIGDDYQLKIADFDLSYMRGDTQVLTKGTRYYRAPELKDGRDDVDASADIFAAGIILFVMRCGGVLPHVEDETHNGVNLYELMMRKPKEFFSLHCGVQGQESSYFTDSFKKLFSGMVKENPEKRISISEIKKSQWYRGEIYTAYELRKEVEKLMKQNC